MSLLLTAALASLVTPSLAAAPTHGSLEDVPWQEGDPGIESISSLAFGTDGVLFLGDPVAGAIFALDTGDREAAELHLNVGEIDTKLAALLGTTREGITVHDLAVNPISGAAYLALTRQGSDESQALVARIVGPEAEEIEVLDLGARRHVRMELGNAPERDDGGRRSRRALAVTDLAFLDGVLYVAGLSNEEFASKLRALPFPFEKGDDGTSIEIYHASHGAWETRSPVRTMVPIDLSGSPFLLCGYTCTPLVKFPVEGLLDTEKLVGTTVAELGNRNTPLDMVVYEKEGARYVLIANTSRGVMKVPADLLVGAEAMTEPVPDKGGVGYETIEHLADVRQLAPIDATHVLVMLELEDGMHLEAIEFP